MMTQQLKNFIETIENDEHFKTGFGLHVRLPSNHWMIKGNKATQIRSKNNDLVAYKFDILGNMTALHKDGYIRQHIGKKEINKALKGK